MQQVLQLAGALFVLAGYVAAQLDALDERSYAYLVANLAGSTVLTVTAVLSADWGFVFLEGAWAAVSLAGLTRRLGED